MKKLLSAIYLCQCVIRLTVFVLAIIFSPILLKTQTMQEKNISVGGMSVRWHLESGAIYFHVSAPTNGWVAVGFNVLDDIVHTNLIMAAVDKGKLHIEDQYVVRAGEHVPVAALGGVSAVSKASGREVGGHTEVSFCLPQHTKDHFHYNLTEASKIYLICAYSAEDDFAHHSLMRHHVAVVL